MQVLLPMDDRLMGKLVEVEITGTTKFSMFGSVAKAKSPTGNKALKKGAVSGARRRSKSKKQEEEASWLNQWMYRISVVVLALAIGVRVVQVLYMHFMKSAASSASPASPQQSLPK